LNADLLDFIFRNMISLMNQNIALNDLEDTVKAEVLNWYV